MRYNNREPTNQKKIAWWQRMTAFLLCCGMIANFVIPSDFVLPAIAEEETEELVCAIEEHTHSPDCYELICEDNSEEHEHTDECYELICGMEEHVHNEECYQYEEKETAAEEEQEFYEDESQDDEKGKLNFHISSTSLAAPLAKDGSNPWFDSIQTTLPVVDAVEIKSSNITGLTINDAGTTADAGNNASLALSLVMSYKFSTAEKDAIIANGGYIYFNIDTNPEHPGSVRLTQGYSGETCFSDDNVYAQQGYGHCGYYSISQAGLLVLKFTPEYLNYLSGQTGDFTGKIGFDATVDRAQDATGDRTINIGGKTIEVTFNDEEATISKSGQQIQENGKKYIKWTITINNPNGHVNLKGYKLQDILRSTLNNATKEINIGTSNMKWNDNVTFWDGQNNVTFGHWEDGYFVFDKDGGYPSQLTFTYNQEVISGESAANTANLIPTEGETKTASATKSIENKLEISKEGKPDYEVDGTTNKKIEWTITLNNAAADSLNGVEVTDDKFPSNVSDIAVYYDLWNKYTVPSANYSITTDGKLLFTNTDSYTVPSKLYIVYKTNATVDIAQSNTASAHSIVTTNPPADANIPDDKVPSVTYKNETKMVKRGDGYVPNEGKVKWKITLLSAYDREWDDNGKTKYASDTNNKQTLNEYTITDDAFANLSALDFSYNACYLDGYGGEYNTVTNNNDIVEIVKSSTDSKTIIIKVKDVTKGINKLELFYRTPIDTTTAAFKASTENSKLSISNTATYHGTGDAGFTGVGTASEYYYNREGVSKSCVAGGEEVTTFDELDDREMMWKVTLTKDSGFCATDLVFTDVLEATNGGQHYITPEQVLNTANAENAGIRLYNVTTGTASQLTLNTDYTITFKTTDGTSMTYAEFVGQTGDTKKNASEFTITFTSAVNTAGVHVVDLYYNTTAKTDTVTLKKTAEYSNKSTFGNTSDTKTGLKFTHEDPNNAEKNKVTLNISKSWNDGNDAMKLRPAESHFKLMRALVGSDTWKTLKNDNNWAELAESSADYKIFTVSNNSNNWLQLGDSFPKWYVDTSNNNKVTYYRYKVVEVNVNENYTPQYMNAGENNEGEWNAKDGTGTFTVTNNPNFKTYSKKAILDTSGQEVTTYYTADLTKVTINNQKYYLFGWELSFLKDDTEVFEDTIPAGSFLIDSTYSNLAEYQPKGKHNWENVWAFYDYALSYEVEKKETGDVIRFTKKDGTFDKIRYFIAVPVDNVSDSLDGNGNIVNRFKKQSDEEGVTVSVPVIDNEQNNYLEKKASSNSAGLVTYDLYINENGANLSNGDTLEITDYLTIAQKTDEDLKFKLTAFHVYPYNIGTKSDLSPELDATEVSYRDRYDVTESKEVEVQEDFEARGNSFIKNNLTAGETLKITIKGTPNYPFKEIHKWENENYNDSPKLEATLDENGYYTFNYTVPEGVTKFTIDRWNGADSLSDVQEVFATKTETVSTTYPAKLVMTVPDEQCLHIRYVYQVIGYVPNQSNILLNNKASFESENGSGHDEANNTKLYVTKSTAENSIETYPKIYKVDVNNFGLNTLEATFKVAKWDGTKWVYASSIQTLINYEKPSDGTSNSNGTGVAQPHWYIFDASKQCLDGNTWRDAWVEAKKIDTKTHSNLNLTGVSYIGFRANNSTDGGATREVPVKIKNIVVTYGDTSASRKVARLGTVKILQEIIKEDDDIDTISEAIAVLPVQKITKKSVLTKNAETWPKEITLTYEANGWTTTESLPMYDESGQKYYYWVEEIEVNGKSISDHYGGGYAVSYQFTDGTSETAYCIDAVKHGDSEITIKNTPKTPPPDNDDVSLPEAGGVGTAPYRAAGFMLMLTAIAIPYIERKRREFRKSA